MTFKTKFKKYELWEMDGSRRKDMITKSDRKATIERLKEVHQKLYKNKSYKIFEFN